MVTISVTEAIRLVRQGSVVAVPTDTVYGLAGDFRRPETVEQIFALKRRSRGNPLPILAENALQILPYFKVAPSNFRALADTFWPGGLTVVVPVHEEMIPSDVRAGNPTAAFRVPDHIVTLHLLKEAGPLAVTSANHSGEPPATNAEMVRDIFGEEFPVLHGGECTEKVASTIISYADGKWHLLREGAIPAAQLANTIQF